jgi:hypothetical protein
MQARSRSGGLCAGGVAHRSQRWRAAPLYPVHRVTDDLHCVIGHTDRAATSTSTGSGLTAVVSGKYERARPSHGRAPMPFAHGASRKR